MSPAQEALLRVFDRALEVDAEAEGGVAAPGNVSCRLLVPGGQVGCVMGKGGKVIERIRKESGAKIRVLPGEQLPLCASPSDEVVQVMAAFTLLILQLEDLGFASSMTMLNLRTPDENKP